MKRETLIWTIVMLAGAIILLLNGFIRGAGSWYVKAEQKEFVRFQVPDPEEGEKDHVWVPRTEEAIQRAAEEHDLDVSTIPDASDRENYRSWEDVAHAKKNEYVEAVEADPDQDTYRWSFSRTVGVWIAALFTLFIFSFLYRDNPLYKVAEAVVVGVSAAYWMVVGFHTTILPNLAGKISPDSVKWAMPGLDEDANLWYLVPLILGVMLLWRLAPVGGWISRWPLAFIIGVFCGLRLVAYLQGDFLTQIRNAIEPLYAIDTEHNFDVWTSLKNFFLVGGVLACLVYFFFSIEHKGVVGKTAKVGIWVLMITFGAGFGYTVMGRIALLAIRIEFLFDDWLWLIDPTGKRTALILFGL